ncbi:MAG: hypothetical protein PVI43_06300 [Candidatus Bathyarchaeota archaeon]|jgi:hypothetical protein
MTTDKPMLLTIIEKLLGITLIIIGALITIDSTNPPPGDISQFPGIFTIIGVVILAAGIFLLITKAE